MKIYKGKNLQSCEMDIFKNYSGDGVANRKKIVLFCDY